MRLRTRLACFLVVTSLTVPAAVAQTFEEAVFEQLFGFCSVLVGDFSDPEILNIGRDLTDICGFFCMADPGLGVVCAFPDSGPLVGATGSASRQTASRIPGQRSRSENEEGVQDDGGQSTQGKMQLGARSSIFASVDFEDRVKDATVYEDAYEATRGAVSVGFDYRLTDEVVLGLAIGTSWFSGEFGEGGDFDTDSRRILAYGSFVPFENSFIDAVVEYSRDDFERTRNASATRRLGTPGGGFAVFGGPVAADFEGHERGVSVQAGYDFRRRGVSVGPRLGLSRLVTETERHEEQGGTGLELRFQEDTRRSLESRAGIETTFVVSKGFGVLVPRFGLVWVSELNDDPRAIFIEFAEDDRTVPREFSFQSEPPDRDYAELDFGVSVVLHRGISLFGNYRTMLGNSRFDVDAVTLGLRVELRRPRLAGS